MPPINTIAKASLARLAIANLANVAENGNEYESEYVTESITEYLRVFRVS